MMTPGAGQRTQETTCPVCVRMEAALSAALVARGGGGGGWGHRGTMAPHALAILVGNADTRRNLEKLTEMFVAA